MSPDNLRNNNQGVDVSKPSNNAKDFSKIQWLIIGAVIASVPTFINTYINNQAEDKRVEAQALIARQNYEIERSRLEVENFIRTFNEYKIESNTILKNLMKANILEPPDSGYSYAPDFNFKNFNIDDKFLKERISYLIDNITPKLQGIYFQLTVVQNMPIDKDIMNTINGLNFVIIRWSQRDKNTPANQIPNLSSLYWFPEKNMYIPPKDLYKFMMSYTERLDEEIKTIADLRKKIIHGDFQ